MKLVSKWELFGVLLVLFIGLVFFAGCTKPAVSKPQEAAPAAVSKPRQTTTPQRSEITTRGQAKAAPSKSLPASSLEAHRKGTLGKESVLGPLRDVNFDFDRYDLRPNARETLKAHAAWLKANPQTRVEIEGHCDERGTNEYNLALGAKRAQSVKRYLVDSGISAERLSTVSYGEELPLCKEHNEECWAQNRRVRFAIKTAPTA